MKKKKKKKKEKKKKLNLSSPIEEGVEHHVEGKNARVRGGKQC